MKYILLILLITAVYFSQTIVVDHSPNKNSIADSQNPQIEINFENAVLPSSINDTTFMVYGRWTGVHSGSLTLKNNNSRLVFNSDRVFNSGELVTVSLSKGIKDALSNTMTKGYVFQFMIPTGEGTFQLTQIEQINVRAEGEGHIQVYGAFAGDLNADGWTDFTVPNEISSDIRVFLNDGTGSYNDFTAYKLSEGEEPSTNEGADFNLDGHMDFAVGTAHDEYVSVFFGDGSGGFFHQDSYNVGTQIRGLTVLDLNGDGFADIVTANRVSSDIAILMNKGDGTFEDELVIDGNSNGETACMSVDANNDGILDVFVGSYTSGELSLLLGDGDGNLVFSDKVNAGGKVWMIAAGDVNGDGFADVVSANSENNNFSVAFSNGDGTISDAAVYNSGRFPLAIDLGDLDGDKDLDIVLSNFSSSNFEIYENDGSGNFAKVNTLSSPQAGSCAVLHDRDNDGDLDVTGIDEIADVLLLFDNDPSVVSVEDEELPGEFALYQNYPNPFNPSTTISFSIPNVKTPYMASLQTTLIVYNALGQQVATLVNEQKAPGKYSVQFNASNIHGGKAGLSSGVYFYKLTYGNINSIKKLLLLK